MKQVEIEKLDLNGEVVKTKNEIPTQISDLTDGQQALNAIGQNAQDIDTIKNNVSTILNIFNNGYYQITNVSDGDTITDTDFINAVTNNYPVKINNVMCYYCRTQGNLIEYLTAGLNNNNVHLNLVVFDTTTNIITFNQVDIVNN